MKNIIKKIIPNTILKYYRKQKLEFNYRGNNVFCPICGSTFKEFGVFGFNPRKNAKCYSCGAVERHRLLWKYLKEKTNFFDNTKKRVLHFAPEKIFYDIFSCKKTIEYVPCDLFPEFYNYTGNVKVAKIDIINISFSDNFFDIILCNHVLEHIPDDRLAMSELYRVLKKGGWAILQVPIDYSRDTTYEDFTITKPEDREKAFGQNDHVRWYGKDYKDRLKSVGFEVI
jgi:SAM-dependent methyltransferase